ncbi:hypothetical protein [Streptomyces chartreusis]|jgi:hypothetical protein|uniref:hypothetical protein n=1 Tax=Streptomyces chartreusis TaxID=1969 RepID=UPI00382E413E
MAGVPDGEALDVPRGIPEIWIADMARVVMALEVAASDHRQRGEIAQLLGMIAPEPAHQAAPSARGGQHLPPSASSAAPAKKRLRPVEERTVPARQLPDERTSLLPPLSTGQSGPRTWGEPMLRAAPPAQGASPLPYQSLLPPSSEAATLHVLLSRTVPEGPVDLDRLLDGLAGNVAVEELPRQPVRTLRFGVQILVDLGEGMEPFWRDETELVDRVTAIAGRQACQVRYFSGCPLRRSGEGAGWTWKPYRPPARGAKVLVLSDFGCNADSGASAAARLRKDWQESVEIMRRHGCPAVALVPVPRKSIPSWVSDLMPVLSWDRTTTTAQAQVGLS